jgi:hypothetical protein
LPRKHDILSSNPNTNKEQQQKRTKKIYYKFVTQES